MDDKNAIAYKQITKGNEVYEKLLSGALELETAVGVTLGARGRNVLIQDVMDGVPHITKDGVTVAKSIDLLDKVENQAVRVIQQGARLTNKEAGDGTTTTTILASRIFACGYEKIKDGANPIFLQRGINKGLQYVTNKLKERSIPVVEESTLKNVATISANNDEEIGEIISQAFSLAGRHGSILVENGNSYETYFEHEDGFQFDTGVVNGLFLDANSLTKNVDKSFVFMYDGKLDVPLYRQISPILSNMINEDKSVILLVNEIDPVVESSIITHKLQRGINLFVVQSPEYGQERSELLNDLAFLLGGKVFGKENKEQIKSIKEEDFGVVKSATLSMDKTTFYHTKNKEDISDYTQQLNSLLEETEQGSRKYVWLKKRIAKINSGVVTIYVGANSAVENDEIKDRVEDAVNATLSAIEEGIIAGGGLPLYYISFLLEDFAKTLKDKDEQKGVEALAEAIRFPMRYILSNAGENTDSIESTLNPVDEDFGYNVKTQEFGNFIEMGVIDPLKVTRIALKNACSVAGTLLTTSIVITYTSTLES